MIFLHRYFNFINKNYKVSEIQKNPFKLLFLLLVFTICSLSVQAEDEHEHHSVNGARLTGIMAYSLINNGFSSETDDILVVPTVGLNFDYYLSEKWGLGIHSDILLQQFKVEKHDDHEEIIRENPIALCAMGIYKPHHRWALFAGYGIEIEKHENLNLVRFGAEYGIPLPKHWEVALSMEYDYKFNSYGALMFGIGFSKGLKKN